MKISAVMNATNDLKYPVLKYLAIEWNISLFNRFNLTYLKVKPSFAVLVYYWIRGNENHSTNINAINGFDELFPLFVLQYFLKVC